MKSSSLKELLVKALKEQRENREERLRGYANEIIKIKKENINNIVGDDLLSGYSESAEHIMLFSRAILFEERTDKLPNGFSEELMQDKKKLEGWLFDYAKGVNDNFNKEIGL